MATLIDYILIPLDFKTNIHGHALCIDMIPSDPEVSKCNQSRWPSNCTGFHGHHVMRNLASNPGPHHFDPSARPSWRGPGKTAGHLGNCKVDGSVRSQFSSFFTLTVARVPCYEMSCAYITVWATTCRFCEHRQSRAVFKKSQRLTSSRTPSAIKQ